VRTQIYRISLDYRVRGVVVEDRRHIFAGERIGGVGNEHAGLTDGSVAYDHHLGAKAKREKR
jgi:hypothetical protein